MTSMALRSVPPLRRRVGSTRSGSNVVRPARRLRVGTSTAVSDGIEFLADGDTSVEDVAGPLDLFDDSEVLLEGSSAYALASQFSDVGTEVILMTGSTNAHAIRDAENPDATAQAGMDASITASFDVSALTEFNVSGFANTAGAANAHLRIDGPSGTVFSGGISEPGMVTFGDSGVLEAGIHTFTFTSGALVIDADGFDTGTTAISISGWSSRTPCRSLSPA